MGWRFRKSTSIGPFRVTLSKSGISTSVGVPGFRTSLRTDGRRYTTFSVPGTGLSYQTQSKATGCAGKAAMLVLALVLLAVLS